MPEEWKLPHDLTLLGRKTLNMTGVSEVVSFDEACVVLKTSLGLLSVHGQGLVLKNLSLDGGQVAVDGTVEALIYQPDRESRGGLRRLFK